MINGECGIIDNYGNKMEVTYNNNIVTISSGMAVVKGGLIRETTYTTLNATLTDGLYYSVVLEVDLSQTNTRQEFKQGSFKLLSNNGSYPTLQQEDISLSTNTGIYQMELARFQTSASAITNFTDTRKILSYNSLIQELRSAISKVISEDLKASDISYDDNITVKQKIDATINDVNTIITTQVSGLIKYQQMTKTQSMGDADTQCYMGYMNIPSGYSLLSIAIVGVTGSTSKSEADRPYIMVGGKDNKQVYIMVRSGQIGETRSHTITVRCYYIKNSALASI
jgi:cell fate (sporulation/competence/biofilm development) regulator YlbF (YheA/YmcA/DUF963 family)